MFDYCHLSVNEELLNTTKNSFTERSINKGIAFREFSRFV